MQSIVQEEVMVDFISLFSVPGIGGRFSSLKKSWKIVFNRILLRRSIIIVAFVTTELTLSSFNWKTSLYLTTRPFSKKVFKLINEFITSFDLETSRTRKELRLVFLKMVLINDPCIHNEVKYNPRLSMLYIVAGFVDRDGPSYPARWHDSYQY